MRQKVPHDIRGKLNLARDFQPLGGLHAVKILYSQYILVRQSKALVGVKG